MNISIQPGEIITQQVNGFETDCRVRHYKEIGRDGRECYCLPPAISTALSGHFNHWSMISCLVDLDDGTEVQLWLDVVAKSSDGFSANLTRAIMPIGKSPTKNIDPRILIFDPEMAKLATDLAWHVYSFAAKLVERG